MTGLCTGTTSEIAWPSVREGLDVAVAVDDAPVRNAVGELGDLGLDVGPCGAATLAGVRTLFATEYLGHKAGLPSVPVIVLLSTEGLAANPLP